MIRILYVSTSTTLGGAEKTLYSLATRLDPSRFETAGVVSIKPKGDYAERLETAGRAVYSLNSKWIPSPIVLRRLASIIRETRPTIVHAFLYQAIELSRAVKRWLGGQFNLISSPRVHYRSRSLPSLWVDRLLRSADDLMICESDASRDYLIHRLGYDSSKTIAIRNGIEALPLPSHGEGHRVRDELGVGNGDILLGTVGRLERQKGHVYLLEAVAKLRVLHPVRCVIIGEGSLATDLARLAERLRIAEFVRFIEARRDLRPWFAAMDIFVLPSLWEGLPNAVLEAMAVGVPVVATNVDGVPEAVDNNTTGILCEPGDSQALFSAVQKLLLQPDLRVRMGNAGQRRISENFRFEDMLHAYESAYERVAAMTPA